MAKSDPYGQYTTDEPTITQGDYSWQAPQHPRAGRVPRGPVAVLGGAAPTGGGGGGGRAPTATQRQHMTGEAFERAWRHSQERADRMRDQYERGQWSGSPQDYDDAIGPNRSGTVMDTVVRTRNPQTGIFKDEDFGGAGVPAQPKPNGGNRMSGGVAEKVPASVGQNW